MWIINYDHEPSKITIENLQFVKNELESNRSFDIKNYLTEEIDSNNVVSFNDDTNLDSNEPLIFYGIFNTSKNKYTPFILNIQLNFEKSLIIQQSVEFNNLSKLYINTLCVEENKKTYCFKWYNNSKW